MSIAISISTQIMQDFLGDFHDSRRSLLINAPISRTQQNHENNNNSTPANDGNAVIMVLSVLFCGLIFSLGLSSIIKSLLRCMGSLPSEPGTGITSTNTGVKRKALKTFPIINYLVDSNPPGLDSECVICLSDFTPGDRLRLLPRCNHGFHVRCIDKWLSSHSSCPKCRHCLIETCQKIVGCSEASSSEPDPSRQETSVTIPPVGPEGFIHSYRF